MAHRPLPPFPSPFPRARARAHPHASCAPTQPQQAVLRNAARAEESNLQLLQEDADRVLKGSDHLTAQLGRSGRGGGAGAGDGGGGRVGTREKYEDWHIILR